MVSNSRQLTMQLNKFNNCISIISGGSQTSNADGTARNRTPLSTRRSKRMASSDGGVTIVGSVSPTPTMKATSSTSTPVKSKKSPAMSLRERRFKRREATKNLSDGGVAATKAISSNPDTEANESIAHNQNHDGASSSQNICSDIELSNGVAVALQTETTPTKNRSTAIENCRQNLSAKICDLTKRNDDFIRDTSTTSSSNTTPKLNGIVKSPVNGLMPRRSRKGIPHKLDISNGFDDSDIESSGIDAKLPPPTATHQPINGIVNGTIARKRKISKSVSESESTSSWENKAPPDSQCLTSKSVNNAIVLQPEHVLLKTPERRLKLTLRMKRSPMLDDLIESGTNLSDGSGNSAYNTHYAPEYEVFRVEGLLDNSDDDDSIDASSSPSKPQQKRKKRHKTKAKSHRHRHRKQTQQHRQYDNLEQTSSEDQLQTNNHTHLNYTHENHNHESTQYQTHEQTYLDKMHYGNSESKIHNHIRHLNSTCNNCSDHCNSTILPKSSSHAQPMKRLRLIFGNESHTIDIPPIATQSSNTATSTRLIPT